MKTIEQIQAVSQIASREWLIMQNAIPKLACGIMQAHERLEAQIEDFFELRPESIIDRDGVAIIHVHNVLIDNCPAIYEKLGIVTKYETIKADIESAISQGAKGVLLVMDSPGGTVAGNVELANYVAELGLPVVSFAKGLACSAAYKVAAGSDAIVASESATVGNIGTILSWANMDKFWESMGVKFEAIVSEGADLKSTFHLEPNETQREFLQDSINEAGQQFRDHVTQGRAAAGSELNKEVFRAGWYSGERAGSLGLIDAVGNMESAKSLLIELIDNTTNTNQ